MPNLHTAKKHPFGCFFAVYSPEWLFFRYADGHDRHFVQGVFPNPVARKITFQQRARRGSHLHAVRGLGHPLHGHAVERGQRDQRVLGLTTLAS